MTKSKKIKAVLAALANIDWTQVELNNMTPNAGACFQLDGDRICGRAHRWAGHDSHHIYMPLHVLVASLIRPAPKRRKAGRKS